MLCLRRGRCRPVKSEKQEEGMTESEIRNDARYVFG